MRLQDSDANLCKVQRDVRSQRPAPPPPKVQKVQENAAAKEKHVKLMTETCLADYHFSRVYFCEENLGITSRGENKGASHLVTVVGWPAWRGCSLPFASKLIVLCTYHYIVFIPVS